MILRSRRHGKPTTSSFRHWFIMRGPCLVPAVPVKASSQLTLLLMSFISKGTEMIMLHKACSLSSPVLTSVQENATASSLCEHLNLLTLKCILSLIRRFAHTLQ